MNKAKEAVSSILHKAGHHDTTVHESVAPAVQKETVKEQRREEQQVVRDREIHQDHYHTSIQPVHDKQVLGEQHHHNLAGVEHRTHDHRDHSDTKARLHQQSTQFQNESVRAPTAHTTTAAVPEVAGEHVHHHVHETIQPVVHKETIEPHVVHTTIPVHETHYNSAKHHTASALPPVTLGEFQKSGGVLQGRDTLHDHFSGEPNSIDGAFKHTGTGQHIGNGAHTGNGTHTTHDGHHNGSTTGKKPSMMDKLNPKVDADGDGKKGFMS